MQREIDREATRKKWKLREGSSQRESKIKNDGDKYQRRLTEKDR